MCEEIPEGYVLLAAALLSLFGLLPGTLQNLLNGASEMQSCCHRFLDAISKRILVKRGGLLHIMGSANWDEGGSCTVRQTV